MKQLFLLVISFFTISAIAQTDTIEQSQMVYKMQLKNNTGNAMKGYVKNLADSLLYYSTSESKLGSPISSSDSKISYTEIESIRINRKGAAGRGALRGALIGIVTGFAIGLISGDDPPPRDIVDIIVFPPMTGAEKGLVFGLGLGTFGALIGAVTGALSGKEFQIKSHKANFLDLQTFLVKKTKRISANY